MLDNYLKVAFRNLSRNNVFSLINMLGLAVGMGVCLLIYQYIYFELSFDRFHSNAENIYRLTQTDFRNRESLGTGVYTTYAFGPRGKEIIPEIQDFVRIRPWELGLVFANTGKNEVHQENDTWYVDSNFLQVFNLPLKYGDRESALGERFNVVITEQIAIKYFGDTDVIGEVLKVSGGTLSGDFLVTGVLEELPANSHLQFDILLPMKFLLENYGFYKRNDGWELADFVTYVILDESADKNVVSEKFDQLITAYASEDLDASIFEWKIGLQSIADIHLKSDYNSDFARNNGNIQDVWFFSIIAIFILVMAWVNYINLSTALAMKRAKEVGIRKSMGAFRKQLIGQFMMESILINFMSAIIAVGLAFLSLPLLNDIMGKELEMNVLHNPEFWAFFSLVIILGAFFSGLYPAFILSAFKPANTLKSIKTSPRGGFDLRRGLIVFQFLISALLLTGTYLIYKQIIYMRDRNLGIDMEKILVLNGPRVVLETLKAEGTTLGSKYQTFRNKVTGHHTVSAVTATVTVPGKGYFFTEGFWRLGEPADAAKEANVVLVDTDFTKIYELEFLVGGSFTKENTPEEWGIINEEAAKILGFASPEDALHKKLTNGGDVVEVLGVVKNFHWNSLRDTHSPILFVLNNEYGAYLSLKINPSNVQESIAHIESTYKSVFPNDPFHYFFLDDDFNRQYQADLQFGNLFSAFSMLAVFIASLGLFALVSFSATLRIKEIGIRKVFGASVANLMMLLSREYLIILLVSNAFAIPAIVLGGKSWLENFAFKTELSLEVFLIPGLVLLVISFLTVSYRTYIAASSNPVKSLRNEG